MKYQAALTRPEMTGLFTRLYGDAAAEAPARYAGIIAKFIEYYGGDAPFRIFSAPGRSEIGGNHTDHQSGRVLAAAVSVDTIAVVRPNGTPVIRYRSFGYRNEQEFTVDLGTLAVVESEKGSTNALFRGMAARMVELGFAVGGFDCYISSNVLRGSGLSSSAAMEVLVGDILDGLFNAGEMDPVTRAIVAQYAENVYFGKPCGLMDQTACSVGGLITIDFEDTAHPVVRKVDYDFAQTGLHLVVVDTGGNHANLTPEYAAIPVEMKEAAAFFGKQKLREVPEDEFYAKLPQLCHAVSDRAALRAMHFMGDNARVKAQVEALERGDLRAFLDMIVESGESSWKLLQNCYVGGSKEQGLTVALAVSERMLRGKGAWRVHGGGFAGTIQAFVPGDMLKTYLDTMDTIFHKGAAQALIIRPEGAIEIPLQLED